MVRTSSDSTDIRTVLAHVIAAALVICLDLSHTDTSQERKESQAEMLNKIQQLANIFGSLASLTALARKGVIVLECLLVTFDYQTGTRENDVGLAELSKPAREELQRSISVLIGTRDTPRPPLVQLDSSDEPIQTATVDSVGFTPPFAFDDSFLSDQFLQTLFGNTMESMPWDDHMF